MNHFARLLVVLAFTSLAVACGSDEAAQSQARAPVADADRDGRVTRDEAEVDPKLQASFERHDRNQDGELDRGEFAQLEATSARARERAAREDQQKHQLRDRRDFPKDLD